MAFPPGPTKQISPRSLVLSLISLLFSLTCFVLIVWQVLGLKAAALPEELRLARTALGQGDVGLAKKRFDAFISREGRGHDTYIQVMHICSLAKKYELGLDYGAIGLDACKDDTREGRALLNLEIGEIYAAEEEAHPQPHALSYARRAFELDKDNPEILNMYGYLLADNAVSQAQVDEGLVHLDRALQILRGQVEPGVLGFSFGATRRSSPLLLALTEDSYGWALYRRGKYVPADYVRAVDALQQAVSDIPKEPSDESLQGGFAEALKVFYYHLGAAEHAAGRTNAARNALNVALCYDPKDADARRELEALSREGSNPPPPLNGKDGRKVFTPLPPVGQTVPPKSK